MAADRSVIRVISAVPCMMACAPSRRSRIECRICLKSKVQFTHNSVTATLHLCMIAADVRDAIHTEQRYVT